MERKMQCICLFCCCLFWLWSNGAVALENTLLIWSHWGEEPVKRAFMDAVIDAFRKESGISAEIVWMPKNELREKLPFALDDSGPDISYIDNSFTQPRTLRSLADLSDLHVTGTLAQGWELGSLGEYTHIFLPIEGVSSAIYYNKLLLKKAGIVLPDNRRITTQELLAIIKTLKAAGIIPIGEGSKDRSNKVGFPILEAIFRFAGPEKFNGLFTGETTFSDPDVVNALTFWKQVIDAGAYDSRKIPELSLNESIFEVTDGKAAIYFCGTYFYSKYGATERDNGQIGVLDWFIAEQGAGNQHYERLWAAGFGLNKNSHRVEAAKRFLEFLMSPVAASLWVKHVQAPYPVIAEEFPWDSLYSELARQQQTQTPSPLPIAHRYFPEKAAQQMWEDVTLRFVLGEHSVEQFVERMNSRL